MGMFSVLSAFDFCFPLFFIVLFIYLFILTLCGLVGILKSTKIGERWQVHSTCTCRSLFSSPKPAAGINNQSSGFMAKARFSCRILLNITV